MMGEIIAVVLSSPDFLLLALILAVVALVQGVKALCRLLNWLDVTLESSEGRLRALAVLVFGMALPAEMSGMTTGHLGALSLTLCAWMFWRRSVTVR